MIARVLRLEQRLDHLDLHEGDHCPRVRIVAVTAAVTVTVNLVLTPGDSPTELSGHLTLHELAEALYACLMQKEKAREEAALARDRARGS